MKQYWSRKAKGLTPYVAGEQPKSKDIIKLNTNENPYPPSSACLAAINNADKARLRLYPDPDGGEFRRAAARYNGVDESMIFCGNGSDEVLAIAFQAFFDDSLTMCDITYSFYPVWARAYGIACDTVPLNSDFSVPVEKLCGRKCVVMANPNAPTSIALPLVDIERIVKSASGAVIVDEAYVEFGAESALPLLKKYDNLLIVRTLSKSHSLAGLRAAYAIGSPDMIAAMCCIKDSFNSYPLDMLAQAAAAAALGDAAYKDACVAKIISERAALKSALEARGFCVLPSKTNFLFAMPPASVSAKDMKEALRGRGIFVRWFSAARVDAYLRITIGTPTQNEALLSAIDGIL